VKTFYLNSTQPIHIPGFSPSRRQFTEGADGVESVATSKDGSVTVKLTNRKGGSATVRVLPHGVYVETREKDADADK
jgi:hypothetical protein